MVSPGRVHGVVNWNELQSVFISPLGALHTQLMKKSVPGAMSFSSHYRESKGVEGT